MSDEPWKFFGNTAASWMTLVFINDKKVAAKQFTNQL